MVAYMASKSRGFTLVEMLLAVTLSALLLVTVYSTYFSIARSIDTTSETQELLETGRILLEMVKRDIRGITGGRFPLISTLRETNGKLDADIAFVTSAPSATNPLKWSKVGYALIQDQGGKRVFVRKEATNPNDDIDQIGRIFEISRLVSSFQMSFFDGAEWVEQWDSRSTGKLPKQVRITVEISDEKKNVQTFVAEEGIPSAIQ
jgi:general secretion pathway protein J